MLDCERLRRLQDAPEPFAPELYTWDELIDAARAAPPSSVIVVDPFSAGDSPEVVSDLPALLAAAAMTPVVAGVALRTATEPQLRALFELGVTDIFDERIERAPDAARALLESVKAKPLKLLLERSLSRFVSFDALTLVRAAAEVTVDGGGAEELSDIFGSQERTVSGWCAREALPPPRRLLAWLRLILALALLSGSGRRIGQAASAAGYTDHSFRRALRTFLGGGKATREWSVTEAVRAFDAELAMLRERNRQNGRTSRAGR